MTTNYMHHNYWPSNTAWQLLDHYFSLVSSIQQTTSSVVDNDYFKFIENVASHLTSHLTSHPINNTEVSINTNIRKSILIVEEIKSKSPKMRFVKT